MPDCIDCVYCRYEGFADYYACTANKGESLSRARYYDNLCGEQARRFVKRRGILVRLWLWLFAKRGKETHNAKDCQQDL